MELLGSEGGEEEEEGSGADSSEGEEGREEGKERVRVRVRFVGDRRESEVSGRLRDGEGGGGIDTSLAMESEAGLFETEGAPAVVNLGIGIGGEGEEGVRYYEVFVKERGRDGGVTNLDGAADVASDFIAGDGMGSDNDGLVDLDGAAVRRRESDPSTEEADADDNMEELAPVTSRGPGLYLQKGAIYAPTVELGRSVSRLEDVMGEDMERVELERDHEGYSLSDRAGSLDVVDDILASELESMATLGVEGRVSRNDSIGFARNLWPIVTENLPAAENMVKGAQLKRDSHDITSPLSAAQAERDEKDASSPSSVSLGDGNGPELGRHLDERRGRRSAYFPSDQRRQSSSSVLARPPPPNTADSDIEWDVDARSFHTASESLLGLDPCAGSGPRAQGEAKRIWRRQCKRWLKRCKCSCKGFWRDEVMLVLLTVLVLAMLVAWFIERPAGNRGKGRFGPFGGGAVPGIRRRDAIEVSDGLTEMSELASEGGNGVVGFRKRAVRTVDDEVCGSNDDSKSEFSQGHGKLMATFHRRGMSIEVARLQGGKSEGEKEFETPETLAWTLEFHPLTPQVVARSSTSLDDAGDCGILVGCIGLLDAEDDRDARLSAQYSKRHAPLPAKNKDHDTQSAPRPLKRDSTQDDPSPSSNIAPNTHPNLRPQSPKGSESNPNAQPRQGPLHAFFSTLTRFKVLLVANALVWDFIIAVLLTRFAVRVWREGRRRWGGGFW